MRMQGQWNIFRWTLMKWMLPEMLPSDIFKAQNGHAMCK